MDSRPRPILIAGPTASGKSSLALRLAQETGATVINADSQQIYRDWQVLTARPSEIEMDGVPHALYGHVALDQDYSVGHWLRAVEPLLSDPCVIVGGTGLYFMALTRGLANIPAVPREVHDQTEKVLAEDGLEALVKRLKDTDPETAAKTDLSNPRRVLRAWEVLMATGKGLAAWQADTPAPLVPLGSARTIALVPDRDWVYARCDDRFDTMIQNGALEEARRVLDLDLPKTSGGLKAVGASELFAYLQGDMALDAAIAAAKTATRQYAKRQMTWIRNQMKSWDVHDPSDSRLI